MIIIRKSAFYEFVNFVLSYWIKLPTSIRPQIKQGHSRKTSTTASLTTLKSFTVWITINCGKFLKDSNTRTPDLVFAV